jgi:signal transduction histidine kinase
MGVTTGAGLGLDIAREIILAHGGDIQVISNPGKKTEFVIRLPISGK